VKGPSAAGKSHLVNRVLDIFRELGVVIEFSRITPAYLENMAKENLAVPKPVMRKEITREEYEDQLKRYREQPRIADLTGKIITVDELRGIQNSQAPKLLISEGRLRLGTVDQQREATIIEVRGRPTIITTTTQAALEDPEFENRIIPIQIDETEDQTKQILGHEAERFADPSEDFTEDSRTKGIVQFFNKLRPFKVANPFATEIQNDYPIKNIEARRDFKKLLSLSNVVTWLYQHQRRRAKKGLDVVVVTDLADIETVKRLALSALRESISGHSEKDDKLLEVARQSSKVKEGTLEESNGAEYQPLTIKDFMIKSRKTVRRSEQWVRDHVNRLTAEGFLEPVEQNKKPFTWRYAALQPESLEIKTEKYSNTILSAWAETHGYTLLGPEDQTPHVPGLGLDTSHLEAKPSSLPSSEPENSPKSDFGETALPNRGFGESQLLNEDPPKPNPKSIADPERPDPVFIAAQPSDSPERPLNMLIIASDKPSEVPDKDPTASDTLQQERGVAPTGGGVQDLEIPSQKQPTTRPGPVLDPSISGPSDSGSKPSDGVADEARFVRQAFRTEMDRFGQCNIAKIRYLVKDKISDPDLVTRIVAVMAKNGELEPWGHDCFMLRTSREAS
jgi:hypothetical protein